MGKTPKYRVRNFYYRRVSFKDAEKANRTSLSHIIEQVHNIFSTSIERTLSIQGGGELQCSRYKKCNNKDILMQITVYYPGQQTSVISRIEDNSDLKIAPYQAPELKEFLDGDIFALIRNNNIILCCSCVREKYFEDYIRGILRKSNIDAPSFLIDTIAKVDKIKLIEEEGVKELELNSSLYKASIDGVKDSKAKNIMSVISDEIQRIFAKDPELKKIQENENLTLQVSIKFNGREARRNREDPSFGVTGKKRLVQTSNILISEDEKDSDSEFVIVTGSGNRITPDDIRVSERFKVATLGKSIDHIDAWEKITNYADQLEANGVFSQ